MKSRPNKILGLAIGERSILVAEVEAADGVVRVTRTGVFNYPIGAPAEEGKTEPEALGKALHDFLKQDGYTAKSAIFGIPAKWVVSKSKDVPPVDPSAAADLLRMQVEAEFSSEIKDLVHDYAGQTSASGAGQVLLAATPKRYIDQVTTIAEEARLHVQGIAPTAAVLGAATTRGRGSALVVSLMPWGAELAAQNGASPSLLRHIGSSATVTPNVAGEVRRASLQMRNGSANGTTNGNGAIVVWDDAGRDPVARRAAIDTLGPGARAADADMLGAGELPGGASCQSAVALAMAGLSMPLPIDFLHSRLAPPAKASLKQRWALAIGAAALVLLLVIWAVVDLNNKERELAALQAENKKNETPAKNAEAEVATIKKAQAWDAERPRYLGCLTRLTEPIVNDFDIYLTSLTLDDTMKGEMTGKAKSNSEVDALVNRLKAGKHFSEVDKTKVGPVTGGNAASRQEWRQAFTITFKYTPE